MIEWVEVKSPNNDARAASTRAWIAQRTSAGDAFLPAQVAE